MKKPLEKTLIILSILFGIYTILGQTDMLKMYNIPTTANEPGIKLNSKILVSNLVDYENGDFVCYEYKNEMLGKHIRIHRLLGKANDIIEIKDGILYLNEQDFDENMELQHFYSIDFEKFQELLNKGVITKDVQGLRKDGKMMVILLDKIAEQNGLSNQIKVEPKNQADNTIKEMYNQNWNLDNFGPLKVPQGKCFVIGDNRHNSEDSRYIGLINESDIVGTVVKKL
ncbi:signal peptidase I [Sinomicrobium oceani]|uniref:signal peptidase I n=1 Tax=Sinomicrobium oceani TaxID=1150368 RepID=UPI00227BDB36|nr:signal peptidase I [Sinomicrobium oceani]